MKTLIALALVVAAFSPTDRVPAQDFVVIVNTASSVVSLPKADVSKIFLKKNQDFTAVDREKNSKIRAGFTKSVHGRSTTAIESYWLQQIFAGKDVPPSEKTSDADVIGYVRSNPHAIGYVTPGSDLGSGVRILNVTVR